jgi:diguanylate cyclase (GGDEF)-like protein
MALDMAQVLIVDHSPEGAENINSLLRNSGINIRTLFAKTISEAKKAIKSAHPILVIYNDSARHDVPVTSMIKLAESQQLDIAVRFSPEDPSIFMEALTFYSVLAINSEEDGQLVTLVKNLLARASSDTDLDGVSGRLDEVQSRYKLLLDSSREATAYIHEGLHSYANQAYLNLLQLREFSEIEAVSLLELMSSEKSDLKKLFRDMNNKKFPEGTVIVTINPPEANSIEAELLFSPAKFEGEDCIQMMVREVDANAVLKGELDRLRRTDAVTNLANRKTFNEILAQHIEQQQASEEPSAVFYLEADDIIGLRSKLGLSGWDNFMSEVASLIKTCIKEGDIAARFNDNGFSLLTSRENRGELNALANQLVSTISSQILNLDSYSLSVTCSVGFSLVGSLSNSTDEIVDHSLDAFEQASKTGNCAMEYKPRLAAAKSGESDQQWVERIRYAIDNHDIYSVQQSIVNLEGETEGLFESSTFIREEGDDLPSDQFMPIAERNDLGATIDRHVIQGLMTAISGTGDRHIINLSSNSLMDFSFPSWFIHQLEEKEVLGSQIILQLSAPSVEANLKPASRLIEELKASGCEISLSTFDDQRKICALLDHLDISMLKLRPGLTDSLTNNTAHQAIVTEVVRAADRKQVSVIADGIKDAADLAVLWQCGVKLVAGDFLKESPQVVGQ